MPAPPARATCARVAPPKPTPPAPCGGAHDASPPERGCSDLLLGCPCGYVHTAPPSTSPSPLFHGPETTERRERRVGGGATSDQRNGSKWGHFRMSFPHFAVGAAGLEPTTSAV